MEFLFRKIFGERSKHWYPSVSIGNVSDSQVFLLGKSLILKLQAHLIPKILKLQTGIHCNGLFFSLALINFDWQSLHPSKKQWYFLQGFGRFNENWRVCRLEGVSYARICFLQRPKDQQKWNFSTNFEKRWTELRNLEKVEAFIVETDEPLNVLGKNPAWWWVNPINLHGIQCYRVKLRRMA